MIRPIRILHLITELHSGGAEMMLRKLVLGMDRRRFANAVIAMTPGGMHAEALATAGIPVHSLGMARGLPGLAALRTTARLCSSFRPDIVQGWMYHADALGLALRAVCPAARQAAWLWNVRCSDMDLSRYNPLTRFVIRSLAASSHRPVAVLVNSWAGRRHHQTLGYRPRRWLVIPNGFDTDAFSPDPTASAWLRSSLGCPAETPLATMVARVDAMKDHGNLLSALAEVRRSVPHLRVVLVGRGTGPEQGSLAAAIERLGLVGAVHGLGERRDVARILAGSTCAVLSSLSEGFPNVVGEAMACGTPCVVTDVGDAGRIVGDTGLIVPPRQPALLAQALLALIGESPEDHHRRGLRCRQRILGRFALPAIIDHYERAYTVAARTRNQACAA
jgi:glycosyltransferase involved in cell wall biosynthesis